uniref:Uncharacterized protein n=1 Tax=Chromera velia CCMP2878 TaxID=1169474 RepID=A0A0G4H923_9ALVE|eukprot:Cvel_5953.t1-p1 / transcript=Cvel_5953.t1 / gene=Cvel_5953 / organism=Chromera_velia_CCMP2878 / gene_product=hypothetical protein / transcript_product=hypothetical protein / location=Cvel_scaffold284:90787-93682(+) / protein_length=154 / sequence_SO=supercontig / SO=protein_coding / is_pseudo=false
MWWMCRLGEGRFVELLETNNNVRGGRGGTGEPRNTTCGSTVPWSAFAAELASVVPAGGSSRRRGSDFLTNFEREFENAQRELESVPEADVTMMASAPGMVSQTGGDCGGAMGGMALTEGGWHHVFSSHAPHMRAVGRAVGEDHADAPQQQVGDR